MSRPQIDEKTGRYIFESTVTIDNCFCIDSSISAILVHIPGHGTLWIPDKEIDTTSEVYLCGSKGKLVISGWIAKEKRLLK